jgi:hypothetical protein
MRSRPASRFRLSPTLLFRINQLRQSLLKQPSLQSISFINICDLQPPCHNTANFSCCCFINSLRFNPEKFHQHGKSENQSKAQRFTQKNRKIAFFFNRQPRNRLRQTNPAENHFFSHQMRRPI